MAGDFHVTLFQLEDFSRRLGHYAMSVGKWLPFEGS